MSLPSPTTVQTLVGIRLLAHALSTFGNSVAKLGDWLYHEQGEDTTIETEILVKIFQALNVIKRTHKEAIV